MLVPFLMKEAPRSGNDVATLSGVPKAYGEHVVYDGLDFEIKRGERWCVMGVNGAGKSTLLKRPVAGALEPDQGDVKLGGEPQARLLLPVRARRPRSRPDGVRAAGRRLPDRDDPEQAQRPRRLRLPRGRDRQAHPRALRRREEPPGPLPDAVRSPSFLVLDEPTNHLDLDTKQMLVETLGRFEGTMLFVSHDRTFLKGLATRVLESRARPRAPSPRCTMARTSAGWSTRAKRRPPSLAACP